MTEQEFYDSIEKWIQADFKTWTHVTLLAYFCHKYEQKNGVRFRLVRARKGPTLSKEAADFAKLFRTLAPENYAELSPTEKAEIRQKVNLKIYNYINWMFDFKYRRGEQSVNGTRLFLVPSIINEFERMYSKYLSKQMNQNKFEELISWCQVEAQEIFDFHQLNKEADLKMILKYTEMYSLGEDSVERKVLAKAGKLGLLC